MTSATHVVLDAMFTTPKDRQEDAAQALDMVMRGLRFLGQAADINLEEHRIWPLAMATARWADEEGWSRDNFTWRWSKEGPLRAVPCTRCKKKNQLCREYMRQGKKRGGRITSACVHCHLMKVKCVTTIEDSMTQDLPSLPSAGPSQARGKTSAAKMVGPKTAKARSSVKLRRKTKAAHAEPSAKVLTLGTSSSSAVVVPRMLDRKCDA
ncbi:hypothetical protein POSPLADRAFT_1068213 [Postia placenta MAD-698-R-SB12]|uniref:Zn(2)-C6 fungal-type domain-containing protein n=1 Tax=Postia placenta MAD-698-R-SB12 TaxID=670580 RepID=A0A1X6MIH8_9APHY|nr:hypothetical protein POSPLADRAFT_1068213 [Postia placenta MAD-698-R-SB12]OSX56160.1 hypothetical protein POSPLADRAFT_1068213 [Postia placenta MAD-698-R-SB12]